MVFKCKMCGGTLEFGQGDTVAVCDSCGVRQTIPRLSDERRRNLYDRADHFRRNGEFDKAMRLYEQILNEDSADAEAYWSLALCRYGIEYVEDPGTHRRVPTVNRLQYTSIFDDADYESAIQHADNVQREIYREQAEAINEIQKEILAISQEEEPFDVFICYKETDGNGKRTPDSVLATDLYYELTEEGFRVFFSRITLEDKLGRAYEPYIFAALMSAKVMVVVGTKAEHFNAAWVRNEWSRYLTLIREGAEKTLIPAYRDMDPYDLPEEFSHLQAQDMSKLGFMQDLVRGIRKLMAEEAPDAPVRERIVINGGSTDTAPLLKRVFLFLEDGEWEDADEYCERVLDQDPECAAAYLGKLMAELKVHEKRQLADCKEPFDSCNSYRKVLRFGDEALKAELIRYNSEISIRNENARMEEAYAEAVSKMKSAQNQGEYWVAASAFDGLGAYKDAVKWKEICQEKSETCRKEAIYLDAMDLMRRAGSLEGTYEEALRKFRLIPDWADAAGQISVCQEKIARLKAERERVRLEEEQRAEERRLAAIEREEMLQKNTFRFVVGGAVFIAAIIVFTVIYSAVAGSPALYRSAADLYERGDYAEAAAEFRELGTYRDSEKQLELCYRKLYGDKLYDQVSQIEPGDLYQFGNYHGSTQWIVLKREGAMLLLISRDCVDVGQYHYGATATWSSSSLRRWLNETFYEEAFDGEEQAKILETSLKNPINSSYGMTGGNDTVDHVFLLCISEARSYFDTIDARQAANSSYVRGQRKKELNETYNGWWLRSPGEERNKAAYIDSNGVIRYAGTDIRNETIGIRPVIWIDLSVE